MEYQYGCKDCVHLCDNCKDGIYRVDKEVRFYCYITKEQVSLFDHICDQFIDCELD